MSDPIKVAIVDGDGAFCRTMAEWLGEASDIEIVGSAPGGLQMLDWLGQMRPDVVLMDVAAASLTQVRQVADQARVIVLHGAGQEPLVLKALRAGALGHLDRQNARPSQAIAAVRAVSRGETVISPAIAGLMLDEIVCGLRSSRGGAK